MPDYSLTVINQSELVSPTFAVFAVIPTNTKAEVVHLAWLTRQINSSNQYTFDWNMGWGFTWAAQGISYGGAGSYTWQGSGSLPADPERPELCQATFSYNGDFRLTYDPRRTSPDNDDLWINCGGSIPRPSEQPSSIGISLNGDPVCAVDAGPTLQNTFTVHPSYYIDAGIYQQGQLVDTATVTEFQPIKYENGNTSLTVTLSADNNWSVTA